MGLPGVSFASGIAVSVAPAPQWTPTVKRSSTCESRRWRPGVGSSVLNRLATGNGKHALIGYRLASAVATGDPVTRGICEVDPSSHLVTLTERRKVARQAAGESFRSEGGVEPATMAGDVGLSVRVLAIDAGFVGVTHAADLHVVTAE